MRHGSAFKSMECWDIVKEHPKWVQAVKSLEEAEKRGKAQNNVINEVVGDDDDEVVVTVKNKGGRPPGRGTEKATRKAAQENSAAIKSSSDTFSQYVERLEKKDETKEKNEEIRLDRKSTRLNSSHITRSRMPSSA